MYTPYLAGPWREREVNWVNADGRSTVLKVSQLIVDLNNDGRDDAVYRWIGTIHGTDFDTLVVSTAPSPDELSNTPFSYEAFKAILGPVPEGDVASRSFLKVSTQTVDAPAGRIVNDTFYWYEVINVQSKNYLMSSNVIYWRPTVITSVFKFATTRSLKLVCQFRGAVDIVR